MTTREALAETLENAWQAAYLVRASAAQSHIELAQEMVAALAGAPAEPVADSLLDWAIDQHRRAKLDGDRAMEDEDDGSADEIGYCRGKVEAFQRVADELLRHRSLYAAPHQGAAEPGEAMQWVRDEILNADLNVLDNDQINYVLGIIDAARAHRPRCECGEPITYGRYGETGGWCGKHGPLAAPHQGAAEPYGWHCRNRASGQSRFVGGHDRALAEHLGEDGWDCTTVYAAPHQGERVDAEPCAWRVVCADGSHAYHMQYQFSRSKDAATATAEQADKYKYGCDPHRVEPLYAHPLIPQGGPDAE